MGWYNGITVFTRVRRFPRDLSNLLFNKNQIPVVLQKAAKSEDLTTFSTALLSYGIQLDFEEQFITTEICLDRDARKRMNSVVHEPLIDDGHCGALKYAVARVTSRKVIP